MNTPGGFLGIPTKAQQISAWLLLVAVVILLAVAFRLTILSCSGPIALSSSSTFKNDWARIGAVSVIPGYAGPGIPLPDRIK